MTCRLLVAATAIGIVHPPSFAVTLFLCIVGVIHDG